MKDRLGTWMTTASGRRFWPLDPRPEDVSMDDIAHALSNLCHYTGHTSSFFSVAEHSVMVSTFAPCTRTKLLGLMHDAHEAYLGDLGRPILKCLDPLTQAEIGAMKHGVDQAIYQAFGIDPPAPHEAEIVKALDRRALATEAHQLINSDPEAWWFDPRHPPFDLVMLNPRSPEEAKALFLECAADFAPFGGVR